MFSYFIFSVRFVCIFVEHGIVIFNLLPVWIFVDFSAASFCYLCVFLFHSCSFLILLSTRKSLGDAGRACEYSRLLVLKVYHFIILLSIVTLLVMNKLGNKIIESADEVVLVTVNPT